MLGYIDDGVQADGAQLALGGHRALSETGGFYVEATILDAVQPDMRVAREEIFGPVLAVTAFNDETRGAADRQRSASTAWPPRSGPAT